MVILAACREHASAVTYACVALGLGYGLVGRRGKSGGDGGPAWLLTALIAVVAVGSLGERLANTVLNTHLHTLLSPLYRNPMEGREALKAWLAWQGGNLYSALDGYDYLVTLYGPVYYYVAGALSSLAGPGLLSARLVSAVAECIILGSTFAMVRKAGGGTVPAVLAAATLLASATLEPGSQARPDMLAWAAFFAAAAFLVPGAEDGEQGGWPLALLLAGLFACGLFIKQSTWVFVAVAVGLSPVLRGWRFAVKLAVALALLAAAGFWLAQALTGQMFWKQVFRFPQAMSGLESMNQGSFAWDRLLTFWRYEYGLVMVWVVGAAWSLAERRLFLPDVLLLAYLPFLFVLLRWTGAEYNHFIPVMTILCMGAGRVLARLGRMSPVLLFPVLLLAVPWRPADVVAAYAANAASRVAAAQAKKSFLDTVGAWDGLILCDTEDGYLALGEDVLGRMRFFDAFELSVAAKTGLWDPDSSGLMRDIASRSFALVVSGKNFQPAAVETYRKLFYRFDQESAKAILEIPDAGVSLAAMTAPGAVTSADPGIALRVQGMENLSWSGSRLALQDQAHPGFLHMEVESSSATGNMEVSYWPRMNVSTPGSRIEIIGEGQSRLWSSGAASTGWSPIWSGPEAFSCAVAGVGKKMRITVRLDGEAELWMAPDHPMVFRLATR
jgi:hypothetical protein